MGTVPRGGQVYLRQLDAESPGPKVLRCINRAKLAPYSAGLEQAPAGPVPYHIFSQKATDNIVGSIF